MAVWPFILFAVVAISVSRRSLVAAIIATAIVVNQVLPDSMLYSFFLWHVVGTIIVYILNRPIAGGLVIASGLCYPVAKYFGFETSFGSLPFVFSDMAIIAAAIVGASGGLGNLSLRGSLDWPTGRLGIRPVLGRLAYSEKGGQ